MVATENDSPPLLQRSDACEQASGWRGHLCRVFSIDLRTLALFRILLATLLLIDLFNRWSNIEMLYTDQGVMHRDTLVQLLGSSVKWTSLHYHTGGSTIIQSLVFLETAVCALLLLVGCRTWLFTLISWVLFVSLNRRLPNSASGADIILRILLFWSLFLPLGARWSVDRALDTSKRVFANRFASVATGAILLQVCYIYWFTVLLKMHPDWLEGRALGYALRLDTFALPSALWLRDQESLTKLLTYATLVVEMAAPFVALSPWFNAWCRWLAILSMWGLHLGIAICMNIGLFPYVSLLCWVLFIPTETWDWLEKRFRYTSLVESIVGFGRRIGAGFASVVPRCKLQIQPSQWASWGAAAVFLFVTAYNILGLEPVNKRGLKIPRPMQIVAKLIRLDQRWAMFAPTPNTLDGWYSMPSKLADGSEFDIWRDLPVSSEKPELVSSTYPSFRINRLMNNNRVANRKTAVFWKAFASYLVRRWNETHPPEKTIKTTQVVYFREAFHDQPAEPSVMVQLDFE